MKIRAGFEIAFDCPQPTPMLLMVSIHPSRLPDLLSPHVVAVDPAVPLRDYTDGFGNTCTRIVAPPGLTTITADFTISDTGLADEIAPHAEQHRVEDLPDEVLVYLLGSRYCDTDRMSDIAWQLFGNTPLGWSRVQAIIDWAHKRIRFDYQLASSTRSAFDGYNDQVGVCRDFAHLAITLCRCMNIPARYCTGYLGDIGVPVDANPMDFSAWFQVFLSGRWYTVDARHNKPRIGRILMATGRDATDVAISTSFGVSRLATFRVITEELPD